METIYLNTDMCKLFNRCNNSHVFLFHQLTLTCELIILHSPYILQTYFSQSFIHFHTLAIPLGESGGGTSLRRTCNNSN